MSSACAESLPAFLSQVSDPRGRRGQRHPLPAMLTAVVTGMLCGNRGYKAIVEWLHDLPVDVWHWMGYPLPEIRPLITEYQRHRLGCPGCGESTCAPLPAGLPTGQSGPRLVAFTELLMAYFRQSHCRTALFLETVCGVPCSTALTVKQQTLVTKALRPAYEELAAEPHPGG